MDLLWRVAAEFILHGRSLHIRASFDKPQNKLLIHDESQPLERSSLRAWNRLSRKPPSADSLKRLDDAISSHDAAAIYHLVSAAVHRACIRIRIVSQAPEDLSSIHLLWCSAVHNVDAPCGCVQMPHSDFDFGATIAVTVHESVAPWVANTFYAFPHVREDPGLWVAHGRQLQTAYHCVAATPSKKLDVSGDLDMSGASPVICDEGDDAENVTCVACCEPAPFMMITFIEKCGHPVCIACATACGKKHVDAPHCTRCNMPCPAMFCPESLSQSELRGLVSEDDFAVCEFNEICDALEQNGTVCPNCSCIYEQIVHENDETTSDALRDRFVCRTCSTEFCVKCGASPFHEGRMCRTVSNAPACRYCGGEAVQTNPHLCAAPECVTKGQNCCTVTKPCGHLCHGTRGEHSCVSCLAEGCSDAHSVQRESDLCVICYVDTISEAPCLQLTCGHVFHAECLRTKLAKKWPTPRITFHFMDCPFCGKRIVHHLLSDLLQPLVKKQAALEGRYPERLRIEGLLHSNALTDRSSQYFNDPIGFAKDNLTFYECFRCSRPYFGGLKQCNDVVADDADRADLICGGCTAGSSAACAIHGTEFIQYKCRYCCSLAVWFCWGTTHFCEKCHNPPRRTVREECPGEERCPLKGRHPPNGTEFALSCAICASSTPQSTL